MEFGDHLLVYSSTQTSKTHQDPKSHHGKRTKINEMPPRDSRVFENGSLEVSI
jgi:hypothetical protein